MPNYLKLSFFLSIALSLQACNQSGGGSGADASSSGEQCASAMDLQSYFQDVTSSNAARDLDTDSLRNRTVTVDTAALKADLQAGRSMLKLDLFSDMNFNVVVERIQKYSAQNYVVTGHLANQPLSSVSLAIQENVLVGNINPGQNTRYRISYAGNGTHNIQEMTADDHEDENSCLAAETSTAQSIDEADVTRAEDSADGETQVAMASVPVIDMLVAYTPGAKAAAGGEAAIKAMIQTGIADTNKAFADSGVNLAVRLVGIMSVSQNETGNWSSDLSALAGKSDGLWDEVHAERTRLGADQVSMVATYSGSSTAGIGYINSTSSTMFSITKVSAFKNFSFTHELGHNVGLNHSDGYVNSSGSFRTIMAYGTVTRILRFSNPGLVYKNYATGTSSNNSASILNANGSKKSILISSKTSDTVVDIPVQGSPGCY